MATQGGVEGAGLRDPTDRVEGAPPREAFAEIEALLRERPHAFGFFQAVRLLERLFPERALVGEYHDPATEVVRFGVPTELAFPPNEIRALTLSDEGPPSMLVNFFGVTGPQGVLPHAYTLLAQERARAGDHALADFLDLFHHRLLSLFYRAWRKYRFTVAREDGAKDGLHAHLLDLVGMGLEGDRNRMPFPDEALVFRAGLLAPQPRSAAALVQLLRDFFGVPAALDEFVGGWFRLEEGDRCTVAEDHDGPANALGGGAVLGDEIWDPQARVRVRLGPLDRERYEAFLPDGAAHRELEALVRFFTHDQFECEVQLVLAGTDVPGVQLGRDAGQRLGWTTWIRSAPRHDDADDTVLTLHRQAAS